MRDTYRVREDLRAGNGDIPGNVPISVPAWGMCCCSGNRSASAFCRPHSRKNGRLEETDYCALIDTTTQLNLSGPELAKLPGVHAMTDVTGFGLLGHLLEMCRGAGLSARLRMSDVPLLDNVLALAEAGCVTGASARNWASYGVQVQLDAQLEGTAKALLCDPQTSVGLLVGCAQHSIASAMEIFGRYGFGRAAPIGRMCESVSDVAPRVTVEL